MTTRSLAANTAACRPARADESVAVNSSNDDPWT
jgi:hypothetical protein